MVVSIICCFVHREARNEFVIHGCELLKKIKFLDSDYSLKLRHIYSEKSGLKYFLQSGINKEISGAGNTKPSSLDANYLNEDYVEQKSMLKQGPKNHKYRKIMCSSNNMKYRVFM